MEINVNVYERLQTAKENGELVPIAYHGGSHPGKTRLIYPTKVTETEVWGREADGTLAKCFKLAKLELASQDAEIHNFSAQTSPPEPETLAQVLAPYLAEIETSPLEIERDETFLGLYDHFKNGKRRRHPLLCLHYVDPLPYRMTTDWETGARTRVERPLTGNEKPWAVNSPRGDWNFKKLSSAVIRFMEEFRAMQK
jgi:hypothetical protein